MKLEFKDTKTNIEAFFVEISLQKNKWLQRCCYNPYKSKINKHLNEIGQGLDSYLISLLLVYFNIKFNATDQYTEQYIGMTKELTVQIS